MHICINRYAHLNATSYECTHTLTWSVLLLVLLEVAQPAARTDDARQTRLHIPDRKDNGAAPARPVGVRVHAGLRSGRVVHAVGVKNSAPVRKYGDLILDVVGFLPDGSEEAGVLEQGAGGAGDAVGTEEQIVRPLGGLAARDVFGGGDAVIEIDIDQPLAADYGGAGLPGNPEEGGRQLLPSD